MACTNTKPAPVIKIFLRTIKSLSAAILRRADPPLKYPMI